MTAPSANSKSIEKRLEVQRAPRIKHNKLQCLKCKDIIESKYTWDFKFCKCGAVAIDGGQEYVRIIGDRDDWKALTEYEDEPSKEDTAP